MIINNITRYGLLNIAIVLGFFMLAMGGCKSDKNKTDKSVYPTLHHDEVIKLFNRCNQLDLIFHQESFSMSMTVEESIKTMVSFISTQPVKTFPSDCINAARATFVIDGEIEIEADIHLGPSVDCNYFIFVDKQNKPSYANKMTSQGVQYFQNVFQQANKVDPNKRR